MNDELLVSYLLGEAGGEQRQLVERWIAASDRNQKYYEQFRTIWEQSIKLAPTLEVDERAAWLRFRMRIEAAGVPGSSRGAVNAEAAGVREDLVSPRPAPVRKLSRMLVAAASVLLAVAIVALVYFVSNRQPSASLTIASVDSVRTTSLPDGSVVTLNKQSQIRYPSRMNRTERRVQLKGEAFFEVEPDPAKPFIVEVNDVTITVLGTSFNVKAMGDSVAVHVKTGRVRVERKNKNVLLEKNESVVVSNKDSMQAEPVDGELYDFYRSREFVCDNTPLWKLVRALNEAYGSNIIIGDSTIRQLPLTATFQDQPLEDILEIISQTFDISVGRDNGRIILK